MATLHFIHAWPGAGKTTLARKLAAASSPAVAFIEDEWLATLAPEPITMLAHYLTWSGRIRRVIAPIATQLLTLGTNVIFDFAANTIAGRAWVRSIFEAADADHVLHVLDVPAAECKRRLHERNRTKPAGLYFGDVADDLFDAVVQHIVPPSPDEEVELRQIFELTDFEMSAETRERFEKQSAKILDQQK